MSPTVTSPILFQLLLKRCMACCMSIYPTMSWEGPLPNSTAFQEAHIEALQGNKGLCGNVIELQPCRVGHISKKGNKIIFFIIFPLLGTLSLVLVFFGIFFFAKRK